MPVTAKLSREFYARFGDDVVNELIELLNRVDCEYRSELRQQNELNFARFDARLDQRFAELEGKMGLRFAEVDSRFAELEARFDLRLAGLDGKIDKGLAGLDAKIDKGLSGLREEMATLEASTQRALVMQSRWMLAGWAGVMIAILLK